MVGVDYSGASVEFCRARWVALEDELAEGEGIKLEGIDFQEWDIMHSVPKPDWTSGFDVVLDKGTFDAISLSSETDPISGRRICESYREKVEVLIKLGGYLVITSCNWTEEELKECLERDAGDEDGRLEAVGRVEYPVFSFGGKTGQSISTVCFQKKKK